MLPQRRRPQAAARWSTTCTPSSTRHASIAWSRVESEAALRAAIKSARRDGKAIAIAGGRHSMGGQQFASGAVVIDTRPMRRELRLDAKRGIRSTEQDDDAF